MEPIYLKYESKYHLKKKLNKTQAFNNIIFRQRFKTFQKFKTLSQISPMQGKSSRFFHRNFGKTVRNTITETSPSIQFKIKTKKSLTISN